MSISTFTALEVRHLPTESLNPYANNPKLHPEKQVRQIAACMRECGFINPIIVDKDNVIIAGHGRYAAAKLLGLKEVPTIVVDHLTDAQVRAYRLADNQLALNSGYDNDLLKIELVTLAEMDLSFDLEITGFETAEIDLLLDGPVEPKPDPADAVPEVAPVAVTQPGDIWQLGKHRLICGDSTKPETYAALMQGDKAQAIITDPPYSVPIQGHVCGLGKIKHREFLMGGGEMTDPEFDAFLEAFMANCVAHSVDGSLHYVFIDWRHVYNVIGAGRQHYSELKNICVWAKLNGGMGAMYRSQHEMVVLFKNGTAPHINTIQLGKYGRYRTNVWTFAGVNSFGKQQEDLKMHPTVKPVAMLAEAIKDCTRRKQIVLDPFGGSGSTLIACEDSGRLARCIELDPLYCDVIIRRWQQHTGGEAVHVASGMTFAQIEALRAIQPEMEASNA
ncbi:MAG: DNA methylase N-4 [Alphaproteobacteria bacterium]|nr:DNA methylase N-4 [Alphaproteobacteria bacterium]